jgi:murein DD-endopeptidase MepM/ murein hydrolase activator NlpD
MIKCLFAAYVNFILILSVNAQKPAPLNYPKGYFRYPLAIAPKLNANFGEMRPNHFHMGLDLFTLRKENLPIYAAAEGYVSRVKIEAGGFGNAIYIAHPNGLSTLYAHMNEFMPDLEEYVRNQQYHTESWSADLNIHPSLFPVKKGDFIGYSGNTGGSQGPHVHFEIRETATDKCVNPLLFGFNIPDNVPPDVYKIALYNRDISSYEQTPIIVPVKKTSQGYVASPPRLNFDKIIIAVQSTDRMTGVPNNNGIFMATLFKDQAAIAGFRINGVGYDQTRYLNAHIDYKTRLSGGAYLQHLFPLPGDKLDIYPYSAPGSFIHLEDTAKHQYRLEIKDSYGNTSNIRFSLQRNNSPVSNPSNSGILMMPGELNVFESPDLQVYLPERVLYDSIYFKNTVVAGGQPLTFSPVHTIHTCLTPLHDYITIRLRPDKTIPYQLRDRLLIKKITRNVVNVRKADWEMGMYSAKFREFGTFQLIADNQPPVVSGLVTGSDLSKAAKITIYIRDNYDQVKDFRAELDGKWLRFVQRGNTFTYKFDENCPRGEHELKISVVDEAGNKTAQAFSFKR